METFLLISAIIVTLITLTTIHRFNHNLANFIPTEAKVYLGEQPLHFINIAGKWLTFVGGVSTFPLVMGLIFTPESNVGWIATLGVFGCQVLFAATLLLIPAFIIQCLNRKVSIKRIVLSSYHAISKKVLKVAGYKMLVLIPGIFMLALFVPFVADLLTFLVYIVGFVLAARLGLLDSTSDNQGDIYDYYSDDDHDDEDKEYQHERDLGFH